SGGTEFSAVTAGPLTAADEKLNNTEVNQYSGPNNSQRIRIEGNEWPANQTTEIEGVYVEFSASPNSGTKLHVDSISLGIAGVSINTMKANIYYSIDPDFNDKTQLLYSTNDESGNNYLQRDSLQYVSDSPEIVVEENETIYLRIYPWVDNDSDIRTGKYIALQNVTISGEVESVPVATQITWPLDSDENPVIAGHALAEPQSYSEAMAFYSFEDFATTQGNTVSAATIQTVSQEWIAATEPTDSLYFQYTASPKFGGTFFADSFAINIGAWFTQNIRAEIYYSKDSSFTDKNILVPDRALLSGELEKVEAAINDTVETGEQLYIRVYPYNTESEGWAKLVAVDSVVITGSTIGVTSDPPEILTVSAESISTTFVTSGGYIPSDGGAAVTSRGVVWNTTGDPDISGNKTTDGTGSGSFESKLTGLEAGSTYYYKAYATNEAGTSYGSEFTFTTLAEKTEPEVTTNSISEILVETAQGGGEVTAWGGDSVKARGLVWNTEVEPTLEDNFSEAGSGMGSFVSTLYPLEPDTRYYVRAYATNGIGTGYGQTRIFTTKIPAPDVTKIVALDGSGDYTSVQDAFDDVPDFYTGVYTIFVKNGEYYEKLFLDEEKVNVNLIGESRDSTILTYDDYAGISGGTSQSYSVSIDADDFVAENITFQNTIVNDKSVSDQQAVALVTNGDRQAYYNVNILGYQDTFYARGSHGTGRIYIKNSYIEGSVDFIFGRNIVVFDSTQIHINRNGGTLTAAATEEESKFGFVFLDNVLSADSIGFDGSPITSFYLGRPWQNAPRTVFINTWYPASLNPEGWLSWNVPPAMYGEYNCSGPGCVDPENRADFSIQLSAGEAAEYTIENIFSKESNPDFGRDWIPSPDLTVVGISEPKPENEIPNEYEMRQNYPNPFNPSTKIGYSLPKTGHINISVYDLLGRKVTTLVNERKQPGEYEINFDASNLASGIYFYRIEANNFSQVNKMTLMK
ncbi:MAG: pectinesterase family protein, partial [Gracilimonas sp.]